MPVAIWSGALLQAKSRPQIGYIIQVLLQQGRTTDRRPGIQPPNRLPTAPCSQIPAYSRVASHIATDIRLCGIAKSPGKLTRSSSLLRSTCSHIQRLAIFSAHCIMAPLFRGEFSGGPLAVSNSHTTPPEEIIVIRCGTSARRWQLFAIVESVGELGLQLRNVEYGMDANSGRALEGECHGGWLKAGGSIQHLRRKLDGPCTQIVKHIVIYILY